MKKTISDIAQLLKSSKEEKKDSMFYAKVNSLITEGGEVKGYKVSLDGTANDTIEAKKIAGAKVGDVVQVNLHNGHASVTGTVGGDTDAKDAQETAEVADGKADAAQETAEVADGKATTAQERADSAYEEAQTAIQSADSKSTVYHQTSQPSGGTYKAGDTWFDTDDGYKMYTYNGSSWVAEQFGNSSIASDAINTAQIVDNAVKEAKLNDSAVTTNKISALAVTTAKIDNLAVTNGKIANLAVDNTKIANATIGTAKIADAAITNAKIADATIQNAKIATLDAGKITTGTLDANRIAANSITGNKININTAIYSGSHSSIDSTNPGAYLGVDGISYANTFNIPLVSGDKPTEIIIKKPTSATDDCLVSKFYHNNAWTKTLSVTPVGDLYAFNSISTGYGKCIVTNDADQVIYKGSTTISIDGASLKSTTISFGHTFSSAPYVFCTCNSAMRVSSSAVVNSSNNGATIYAWGVNSTVSGTATIRWMAIGTA